LPQFPEFSSYDRKIGDVNTRNRPLSGNSKILTNSSASSDRSPDTNLTGTDVAVMISLNHAACSDFTNQTLSEHFAADSQSGPFLTAFL
jgi:hypothetical protein